MRLAVVSPFVDRRHGTERALAELLERLARDDRCEIHLYSQRVEDLRVGLAGADSSAAHGARSGTIIWHKVPSLPGPHIWRFLFWLFANTFLRRWDQILHRLHFDLVLSPGINCFDADIVIAHALFHRLRELACEEASASGQSTILRRFHRRTYYSLLTWLERRIYAKPSVSLAAVSRRTAALLRTYFHREDVRVIPNGVDVAQFSAEKRLALRANARSHYKFQDADFVLLFIGNDWRNKGLATIFAAMSACRDVPLHLLVAGQDATSSAFLEEARKLGLSKQCRWETAPVDAIRLYAAADAYVSPTREDAFALPPLEAMACGLPPITSINNGGSEIITEKVDGFILIDPNDANMLAGHLRKLQEQPELCRRIGENAVRTAQAYTWDRSAAETRDFLLAAKRQRATQP